MGEKVQFYSNKNQNEEEKKPVDFFKSFHSSKNSLVIQKNGSSNLPFTIFIASKGVEKNL